MSRTEIEIREQVVIQAPPEEVFALVVHPERRLQLGPDWGDYQILEFSPDYPQAGSSYRLEPVGEEAASFAVRVTANEPGRIFSYQIEDESALRADWLLEPAPEGTRLTYRARFEEAVSPEEEATSSEDSPERRELEEAEKDFGVRLRMTREETAGRDARAWLGSIKRYAELREGVLRLGMRRLFDRFILPMRAEQRRVILALIGLQIVMFLTFVAAAVGLGIASLIF